MQRTPREVYREKIAFAQTQEDDLVTLNMPARIWAGIDAGVDNDNAVSTAAQNGDEVTVLVGAADPPSRLGSGAVD